MASDLQDDMFGRPAPGRPALPRPQRPPSENAQAFDARRCHFCGAWPALFGFSPPFTPWNKPRWTCREHRADMEALVAAQR